MIGMMYLVLTALLALNISKDVLEAFVNVDESLTASSTSTDNKLDELYTEFDLANSIDPKKVQDYWMRAQYARKLSSEAEAFIDSLKTHVIASTEKIEVQQASILPLRAVEKKDDYDVPTNILVGEKQDGTTGLASHLKKRLAMFQDSMMALLDPVDQRLFNKRIDLSDRKMDDQTSTWEANMFYHTPLAASVVILSKLKMDVTDMEYDVVSKLYGSFNKKDFFFDTIAATVLANSNYVLLGEEYASDIIVAAYSTTKSPRVRLGKLNEFGTELTSETGEVPTENGRGMYRTRADREGLFTYEGMVDLTDSEGEIQSYPFRSEYIVARPSLVVSPTAMNVLYRGIENPVSISVPGIPSENLTASISGGHQLQRVNRNDFMVKMNPNSPHEVSINVSARMSDGSTRSMGKMTFRAKRLPAPYSAISGKQGTLRMTAAHFKAQVGLSARYPDDFAFDLTSRVKKYRVYMVNKQNETVVDEEFIGSKFPNNLKRKFEQVRRGYRVTFEEIRAVGDDDVEHTLAPIIIKII